MPRVAAIDCGTNSIRLLVADVTVREDGSQWLRDVHREMRVNRLGQGVDATRRLAPESLARTKEALLAYGEMLRRTSTTTVRLCATSATRDAENRDEFFGMVRDLLGVEAEVITGEEEARLSFAGAVADLDPEEGPFVVADVGGGSTELVTGDLGRRHRRRRGGLLGERRLRAGRREVPARRPPDRRAGPRGRGVHARDARARLRRGGRRAGPDLGGGRGHGHHASPRWPWTCAATTRSASTSPASASTTCRDTCRRLEGMPRDQRAALGPMHPGRVDVIGAGALVVRVLADELAERADITELVVSEHDILDGIARECAAGARERREAQHGHGGVSARRRGGAGRRSTPRSPTAAPAPGSSPGANRWRSRSGPRSGTGPTGAARFPGSGRPTPGCSSWASRPPRTAPTAPDGCSPATAAATCSTPPCTRSASRPAHGRPTSATAWSCTACGSSPRSGARRRRTSPRPPSATPAGRSWSASSRCSATPAPSSCSAGSGGRRSCRSSPAGWVVPRPRPTFGHGAHVTLEPRDGADAPMQLFGCYHVSQQNTFTGRLTPAMLEEVLGAAASGRPDATTN